AFDGQGWRIRPPTKMPSPSEHARASRLAAKGRQSAQQVPRRPEPVVLVAACAQRKRALAPDQLCLSTINGAPGRRLSEWRRRLVAVDAPLVSAESLYAGDHWHAVLEAFRTLQRHTPRVELWVISAGYGLIPAHQVVKPYSATFAAGNVDSVWRGPLDGP